MIKDESRPQCLGVKVLTVLAPSHDEARDAARLHPNCPKSFRVERVLPRMNGRRDDQ
jgi:hypothetical protein